MRGRSAEDVRRLISEKAAVALSLPGVRKKAGVAMPDAPAVVVTVERKVDPQRLAEEEDLRRLFGAENVDVVEATPLQTLFARPEKYGLDADELAEIETRLGYPFVSEAVGVRPLRLLGEARAAAAAVRERISYKPPAGVNLEPLRGTVKLRCHASPDAGWKELKQFLLEAERELVVGMYELTAPHIGDTLAGPVAGRVNKFTLVLDEGELIGGVKRQDRTEERHKEMFEEAFGSAFDCAYALTAGPNRTFAGYYHIKLAVRDRKAFWLSSGSWQSSNQPNLDPLGEDRSHVDLPKYNREWHLIVQHNQASEVLAKYLEGDFKTAMAEPQPMFRVRSSVGPGPFVFLEERGQFPYGTFFPPDDFEVEANSQNSVLPLLTPDNYIEAVTKLVNDTKRELLVQNQNLNVYYAREIPDERFTAFVYLLAKKSRELENFCLILRDPAEHGNSRDVKLSQLSASGFNLSKIRFQVGCHNKGFIADRRTVLVGSHNLTNGGMTANRDASLIVQHVGVAEYFREIFMHDWTIADTAPPAPLMRLAAPGELPPPGFRKYSFWELLDAD